MWEGWDVISEGGIINLVDEHAEEGRGLITRVRLKFGVDLNDERRGDSGEQTGLTPQLACAQQYFT